MKTVENKPIGAYRQTRRQHLTTLDDTGWIAAESAGTPTDGLYFFRRYCYSAIPIPRSPFRTPREEFALCDYPYITLLTF